MSDFGALFAGLVDVPTRNGNDISDRAERIRVNNYYTNALGVLQTTDDFSTEDAESETMGPRDDDYRGNETSGKYDDGCIVHGRRDTSVDSVSRDDGSSVRIPLKGSRLYGLRRMASELYYEHFGSNKRYVSRTTLKTLHSSLENYENCVENQCHRCSVLSPYITDTMSTSSTRAHTQTHLAVVRGSRESGNNAQNGSNFADVFSSVTSELTTGKESLVSII